MQNLCPIARQGTLNKQVPMALVWKLKLLLTFLNRSIEETNYLIL
jgi:hypothetical protein